MNRNRSDWASKLDDVLRAYHTIHKALIRMLPYQLVFGKAFHQLIELEHRALWALRRLNFDRDKAIDSRLTQLHLLDEFRLKDYESSTLYKEKIKRWYN